MSVVQPEAGGSAEHTWLVLQRDLSVWLRKVQAPAFMTIVLDLSDVGTRAAEISSTVDGSFKQALRAAATNPLREMSRSVPTRIQVQSGMEGAVQSALTELKRDAGFAPETIVEEVIADEGAEWVFDDLIVKIVGRHPADERLLPEDSALLYEQAHRFVEAAPWQRWSSNDALLLELKIGSQRVEGIATVTGHEFGKPGLMLMPGRERVSTLMDAGSGAPRGTLMVQFEGSEGPPDLFLRARRLGWPADAALTPNFISIREGGFSELDRRESWPMALALAGVTAHFGKADGTETWGNLDLPTGRRGRYHVRKAPEIDRTEKRGQLHAITVSNDLLPNGSDVQVGVMDYEALTAFRQEADVVVPPVAPFPAVIRSLPVITMAPSNGACASIVDRLKRARPIGATVMNSAEGPMLTVMGERAGFVILTDRPSARMWKRNLSESDGAHVLIVTDGVHNFEEPDPESPGLGRPGRIYGLFECVLRGGEVEARES